jgi:hypothetical protein
MEPYLCPFCIDETVCAQPHIKPEHVESFNEYVHWYFEAGMKAAEYSTLLQKEMSK